MSFFCKYSTKTVKSNYHINKLFLIIEFEEFELEYFLDLIFINIKGIKAKLNPIPALIPNIQGCSFIFT